MSNEVGNEAVTSDKLKEIKARVKKIMKNVKKGKHTPAEKTPSAEVEKRPNPALELVSKKPSMEEIEILLEAGATISAPEDEKTPSAEVKKRPNPALEHALKKPSMEVIEKLLEQMER